MKWRFDAVQVGNLINLNHSSPSGFAAVLADSCWQICVYRSLLSLHGKAPGKREGTSHTITFLFSLYLVSPGYHVATQSGLMVRKIQKSSVRNSLLSPPPEVDMWRNPSIPRSASGFFPLAGHLQNPKPPHLLSAHDLGLTEPVKSLALYITETNEQQRMIGYQMQIYVCLCVCVYASLAMLCKGFWQSLPERPKDFFTSEWKKHDSGCTNCPATTASGRFRNSELKSKRL